jgi:hypothetical protein
VARRDEAERLADRALVEVQDAHDVQQQGEGGQRPVGEVLDDLDGQARPGQEHRQRPAALAQPKQQGGRGELEDADGADHEDERRALDERERGPVDEDAQ